MTPRLMRFISAKVKCRSAGIKLRFFGSGLIFQSLLVAFFIFTPSLAAADFFAMRKVCAANLSASIRVRVFGVVRGSPHPAYGHLLPIGCGKGIFVGRLAVWILQLCRAAGASRGGKGRRMKRGGFRVFRGWLGLFPSRVAPSSSGNLSSSGWDEPSSAWNLMRERWNLSRAGRNLLRSPWNLTGSTWVEDGFPSIFYLKTPANAPIPACFQITPSGRRPG